MNISFINSSFLYFLPLALLPLIFHLFFKIKPKAVDFSDLRFIRQALDRVKKGVRFKKYLLLLARTLIMLLIILYFSKPVLETSMNGESSRKQNSSSVIILIDASYSMNYYEDGKKRIEAFLQKAKAVISILNPDDRAGVIVYSDKIESATPVLTNDKNYLKGFIDAVKPTEHTTDISKAVDMAMQLFETSKNSKKSLVILSDIAKHGFVNNPGNNFKGVNVIYFEPEKSSNYSIKGHDIKNTESELILKISCSYFGDNNPAGNITLYKNDVKTNESYMNFNDKNTSDTMFYDKNTANYQAKAVITTDNLVADNEHFIAYKNSDNFGVWIVDGDPKIGGVTQESFYLKNIFKAPKIISEEEAKSENFTLPGVVILANVSRRILNVEEYIKSGGGCIVFPGSRTTDEFNSDYLPAQLGSRITSQQKIKWLLNGHVISGKIDLDKFDTEKLTVNDAFVLDAKQSSKTLALYNSGWPYLIEGKYGNGRVLMFSTSADRDWSNIPGKPVFVPLMKTIAEYASGAELEKSNSSLAIGEPYYFKRYDNLSVVKPDGTQVKMPTSGDEAVFTDTNQRGIYKVMSAGRLMDIFAVNLNTKSGESDLTAISEKALKEYFPDCNAIVLENSDWEQVFKTVLGGKDISRVLLLIALFFMLLEIILANMKSKKFDSKNSPISAFSQSKSVSPVLKENSESI